MKRYFRSSRIGAPRAARVSYRSPLALLPALLAVTAFTSAAYAGVNGTPQSGPDYEVNAIGDANDGVCAVDNCTLREALFAAINNANQSVITFDATAFAPAGGPYTIQLATALPAFTADTDIQGPGANVLTVRGEGSIAPYRIFDITNGVTSSISGLTITNGYTQGTNGTNGTTGVPPTAGAPANGGGIFNAGNLTLTACALSGNTVQGGQGGGGAPNTNQPASTGADARGGAIYSTGSLTITRCTFSSNTASGGGGGYGGSIQFGGGSSGVGGNAADAYGGAIYIGPSGTHSIVNSTFFSNTSQGGQGGAGGSSNFTNGALQPGGLGGDGSGGAIYTEQALTLTSSTINQCTAGAGAGGLEGGNFESSPGDAGDSRGGGIYAGGNVTIGNTIVAGNNATNPGSNAALGPDVFGNFISQGYNLIGILDAGTASGFGATGDQTGTAGSPIDPVLATLENNGGPTPTLRLRKGSPAVDKGKDIGNTGVDQRGNTRPKELADGTYPNAPGGDASDIGAYESQSLPNDVPVISPDPQTINGMVGTPINIQLTATDGDNDPLTYSLVSGTLPDGLTLNPNGTVTGTPTTPGQSSVTFKVNDGQADSAPATLNFNIAEMPSLVVTITADTQNAYDGETTLREALNRAQNDSTSDPITFDATAFATPQTISLSGGALSTFNDVTINGTRAGVTISGNTGTFNSLFQVFGGTFQLNDLTLTNAVTNAFSIGGAIANYSGTVTLNRCTLSNNSVPDGQGGALYNGNVMTLTNCTLAGNHVDFTSNSNTAGGAIYNAGTLTVSYCTITDNEANGGLGGGGIYNNSGATLNLGNSIVAGNTATIGPDISGTVTSQGYNLIGDTGGATITGSTAGNQLNVAPQFAATGLANNGGPTQTIALQSTSPAIDAGDPASTLISDQRFYGRPFDGPDAGTTATVDIGAYEFGAVRIDTAQTGPNFVVNTTDDHDDGTCGVDDCTLREAINAANSNADNSAITFDPTVFAAAQTITLGGTQLPAITTNTTITGPAVGVTINGNNTSRVLSASSGMVALDKLTLSGGNAGSSAGGGISNTATLRVTNCTISGNRGVDGGAIFNQGNLTLFNCTLADNIADGGENGGGAILNNGGTLTVLNCTLSNNQAINGNVIGGIVNFGGSTSIGNTILANPGGNTLAFVGPINSLGNNLSTDGGPNNGTTDIINANPKLDPAGLQDNGGSSKTIALLADSPALNAGNNALVSADTSDADGDSNTSEQAPFDQRGVGFKRIKGGIVDIGAYEIPTLDIARATVTEGNASTTTLNFVIKLSEASVKPVTVTYQTTTASVLPATAGTDYVSVPSTTVTFAPGETTKTVPVTVNGDTLDEANEHVALTLSNPVNAAIGAINDGIINDDDAAPSMSINDVQVTESNGGTVQAQFTVTLSAASGQTVTVVANTGSNGGSPVATPSVDYTALTNVTVTFAPGQTTRPVNVSILGDVSDEPDEKFTVGLSGAVNASISDNTGIGTILDNDNPPTISASAPNLTEGDAGTNTMTFTLTLSAASGKNVTVQVKTANATTNPATAGSDYVAVPLTTVTFLAGETTKTVNVTVNGDTLDELNERIALQLTNPVNATVGTVTDGVIVDNDATPSLSIADAQTTEGPAQGAPGGTKVLTFTITLSAASGQTVTVNAATGNGGTPAATAGSDYVALTSTPITFTPGQTTKTVSITINGDATVEQNEKFGVILSGAVGATLADNSAIGTILNDDAAGLASPVAGDDSK